MIEQHLVVAQIYAFFLLMEPQTGSGNLAHNQRQSKKLQVLCHAITYIPRQTSRCFTGIQKQFLTHTESSFELFKITGVQ